MDKSAQRKKEGCLIFLMKKFTLFASSNFPVLQELQLLSKYFGNI